MRSLRDQLEDFIRREIPALATETIVCDNDFVNGRMLVRVGRFEASLPELRHGYTRKDAAHFIGEMISQLRFLSSGAPDESESTVDGR